MAGTQIEARPTPYRRGSGGPGMMRRVRRGFRLHVRTLLLLCIVRLVLPRAGLVRALRLTDRLAARLPRPAQPGWLLVSAVDRVSRRLVPGSACLAQAITVTGLMRAQGEDPELVIGCRRDGERWIAHAWTERGGELFDPRRVEHQELARCSAANGWRPRPVAAGAPA